MNAQLVLRYFGSMGGSKFRYGKALFLTGALVFALCACGGADKSRPSGNNGNGTSGGGAGGAPSDTCTDGATEDCKVVIHQASGVTSCWTGERVCVDGAWTDCAVAQ